MPEYIHPSSSEPVQTHPSLEAPGVANTSSVIYVMPDTSGLKVFWGDGEQEGENPQDFINGVERSFIHRSSLSEKEKVRTFELWLKSGRAAEVWWGELPKEKKETWESVREAFEERWPRKLVTAKTVEELHTLLGTTVLKVEELGKRVMVNGAEEFSHVAWADKVERYGKALKDSSGLLIPTARRNIPRALRQLVGTQHETWKSFCDAVRAVSITELEENVEFEEKLARMERTQHDPTKSLRSALANISLGPPNTPARFAIQRSSVSSTPIQTPQQAQSLPPVRADTDRLADITRLALPMHPDTPAGRVAYNAQVAHWAAASQGRPPNEMRPYPLTPGTSPVATGECWKCGHMGHLNSNCTATSQVPLLEQRWRSIAASIRRRVEANAAPVQLVAEDGTWIDRDTYNAQVIASYLASQGQGNGDGSAA